MGTVDDCFACLEDSRNSWCLDDGEVGLTGSCSKLQCVESLFGFSDSQECERLEVSFVIPLVVGPLIALVWVVGVATAMDYTKDAGSPAFLALGGLCLAACVLFCSPETLISASKRGVKATSIEVSNLVIACLGLTSMMVGSLRGLFAWRKGAALVAFSLTVAIDTCAIMFRIGLDSDDDVLVRLTAQSRFTTFNNTLAIAMLTPPVLLFSFGIAFNCYNLFAGVRYDEGESTVANSPQGRHDKTAAVGARTRAKSDSGQVASLQRALDLKDEELAALRAANEALVAKNSESHDGTTLQSVTEGLRTLQSQFTNLLAQQQKLEAVQEAIPVNVSTDEDKANEK